MFKKAKTVSDQLKSARKVRSKITDFIESLQVSNIEIDACKDEVSTIATEKVLRIGEERIILLSKIDALKEKETNVSNEANKELQDLDAEKEMNDKYLANFKVFE